MSNFKKADHDRNAQYTPDRDIVKPSTSTVGRVGVTGPISKPSPSSSSKIGVTATGPKSKGGK